MHTHALEQLFGPISLNILKQDETIRIVELRDGKGMSRTLAIVKFLDIHGDALKKAHNKVINGGLLGKTLLDFKIDFDKEYMGSVEVKLPKWLKNDFNTDKDFTVGFMSNIWINDTSGKKSRFLFSEIVEIIPPELK
ncbi:MAG TPA: hypothetical protein VJ945_01035, partial [Flavobacteriaceae bacterium]|nr:hypothetical protein [Flavobacteriaceae bacterium]